MFKHSPVIILTLVVFSLVTSRAWAADCASLSSKKKNLEKQQSQLNQSEASRSANSSELARIASEIIDVGADLERCQKDQDSNKQVCDKYLSEYNEIKKDYPPDVRAMAERCMDIDDTDYGQSAVNMIGVLGGQMPEGGSKACDFSGAKTTYRDKNKDLESSVDKLQDKIRKEAEDDLKDQKRNQEELDQINEEREKLKDNWEESQNSAEDAQTKALNQMRDKQLQLADRIRQLSSAQMTAKQNLDSVNIEMKAALGNAKTPTGKIVNLKSESAINLACVAVAKQTNKENFGTGASKNATSGSARASALKEAYKSCVDEMHELRNTITQTYINSAQQRAKQYDDISSQLKETQEQYSQSVSDYNQALDKIKSRLTQAQQKYYQKDNELANKYNQALQRQQQSAQQRAMNKIADQQKLMGKMNSQGTLSEAEADQIQAKHKELFDIYQAADQKGCSQYVNIPNPNEAVQKINDNRSKRSEGTR